MAKGEIARFEQFLLLSLCFQKQTFKKKSAKGEIAPSEQFLFYPQCFPPIQKTIELHFETDFHYKIKMIAKSSVADLLYVGKG